MTDAQSIPAADFLAALDSSRREEVALEMRRMELMGRIARYRWTIAQHHHRLENGESMDFDLYPFQQEIYQDTALEQVVMGSVQWGKAAPLTSLVHTPSGWVRMGDIRVGDMVSTPDGASAPVIGVYPQGTVPIYRITFEDGRSAECCGEHLWEVYFSGAGRVLTTSQIARKLREGTPVAIPLTKPVEKPQTRPAVHPYLFGLRVGLEGGPESIPAEYLEGSIRQRMDLLAGILESGQRSLPLSKRIARDIQELVWSLGGAIVDAGRLECRFGGTLAIRSIEYVGGKPAQCIMVDHPRHLYITDHYVVTHNTEFLICSAAAMAACGLRVLYVMSKYEKRDKIVSARITPCFNEVPLYAAMLRAAKDRSADVDSARFKHFGPGSINFVGSNSDKDFTSYACDVTVVDEHQECVLDNIARTDNRMSGSPWRFKIIVGNPRTIGTEENANLDWEYQSSDRRQWHIPCDHCGTHQVLGWWSHFIREEKNRNGAILSISARDEDWTPDAFPLDMRPICTNCHRPMKRLSRDGRWVAQNPGHPRHGFQLSNLYNPHVRMDKLLAMYRQGLHNPRAMADFVNDQLGMPWSMEGTAITDRMLAQCSTGDLAGVPPYRFVSADHLRWEAA